MEVILSYKSYIRIVLPEAENGKKREETDADCLLWFPQPTWLPRLPAQALCRHAAGGSRPANTHTRLCQWKYNTLEDVIQVEFIYHVFTCMQGDKLHMWFRFQLLCSAPCYMSDCNCFKLPSRHYALIVYLMQALVVVIRRQILKDQVEGHSQICYHENTIERTQIQFPAFLFSHEWLLPRLNWQKSVYWWKNPMCAKLKMHILNCIVLWANLDKTLQNCSPVFIIIGHSTQHTPHPLISLIYFWTWHIYSFQASGKLVMEIALNQICSIHKTQNWHQKLEVKPHSQRSWAWRTVCTFSRHLSGWWCPTSQACTRWSASHSPARESAGDLQSTRPPWCRRIEAAVVDRITRHC